MLHIFCCSSEGSKRGPCTASMHFSLRGEVSRQKECAHACVWRASVRVRFPDGCRSRALRAKRVLIEIAGPLLPSHVLHHFLESWSNEKWECAGAQSSIELGFFENLKKGEKILIYQCNANPLIFSFLGYEPNNKISKS